VLGAGKAARQRDGVRLYVVAVAATIALALPTPVYWDTWGYVRQAIAGDVGGLGLGRPVFVLASQAIAAVWLAGGGSAWHVEPVLRVVWAALACAAAPLTWRLALLCGLPPRAAVVAGLAVACSPAMAHVSGTLLTDAPAAALLLLALVSGARAATGTGGHGASSSAAGIRRDTLFAAASGVALGLAIGVREQAMLGIIGLALLAWGAPRARRARLSVAIGVSCATAVLVPIAFVLATQPGYLATVRAWLDGMARDRALRTFSWRDAALALAWLGSLGPVVVIAAIGALARSPLVWRPRTILFAVAASSLVPLAAAIAFRGIAYSPRFLLAGFAGAIAIPGALVLDRWAAASSARLAVVLAAIAAPVLIAAPIVHVRAAPVTATFRALPSMLGAVPSNAAIVTGAPCPAIPLVRELLGRDRAPAAAPDWQPVCPGWSWPADLTAHLDALARAGRPIVIDLRPTSWVGAEQEAAFQEAAAYARQRRVLTW
jgi:hypothetical protein